MTDGRPGTPLRGLTDVELAVRSQHGDKLATETLVRRYTGHAYGIANDYFIPGADRDDVRQEALLGLDSAIRTYRPDRGPFVSFARLAIVRRLITAVKAGHRGKSLILTRTLRVIANDDGEPMDAVEVAVAPHADPFDVLAERESIRDLVARIKKLSPLERRALVGVCFEGRTYNEIEGLPPGAKPKRIDNAIERARRRLAA